MLTRNQAKKMLPEFEACLKNLPEFKGFDRITVEEIKEDKKPDYWGTSIKRYTTDGADNFNVRGYIYINTRDIGTYSKLLEAIVHEGAHLLEDKSDIREVLSDHIKEYMPEFMRRVNEEE